MLNAYDIVKQYTENNASRKVLDSVSLDVRQGEFVAVVGRSGSGKTTLLHVLSSLLAPDNGTVRYKDKDITSMSEDEINMLRRHDFAVVFQFHYLMPYLTALENALLPVMQSLRPVSREMHERARTCLARVGLETKANSLPSELSGGEQQRVAIARALVKDAAVLFADEPTGSLDQETGASILDLMQELHQGGMSIVMVTHEPAYARRAERILTMRDGRLLDN